MKYDLSTIAGIEPLPLTIDEFKMYFQARKWLLAIRDIEFSLDVLLENYHDFVDELLRLSTRFRFNGQDPFKNRNEYFLTLDRKISNYFSTFYQYSEHTAANLKRGFGRENEIHILFKTYINEEQVSNKGFLVALELRGVTQHSSYPLHLLQYPLNWQNQDEQDNGLLMTRIIPYLQVSYFLKDEKHVVKNLEGLFTDERRDCIDLRYIIAESMNSTVTVHNKLLPILEPYYEESKRKFDELVVRASQVEKGQISGLYLRELDDNDVLLHRYYISSDFFDEINLLRSKHSLLNNINKWGFSFAIKKNELNTKRILPD